MKSTNKMNFYKYQALSDVKHFEFIQNYFSQKVWLTPLKNFNDPFEGQFKFVSFSPDYILKNSTIFNQVLQDYQKVEGNNFSEKDLNKLLRADEFTEAVKVPRVVDDLFSNHGALCLTPNNSNIPMWAYYADNHKGCCIVFELDFSHIKDNSDIKDDMIDEFRSGVLEGRDIISFNLKSESDREFAFVRVRYSDVLSTIELEKALDMNSHYDQTEYLIRNSVGVKFSQWGHEDEYRLISNSNSENCGLLNLTGYAPFLKVTGIILGSKMELFKEAIIRDLCQKNKINLYRAKVLGEDYKIIIEKDNCSAQSNKRLTSLSIEQDS